MAAALLAPAMPMVVMVSWVLDTSWTQWYFHHVSVLWMVASY